MTSSEPDLIETIAQVQADVIPPERRADLIARVSRLHGGVRGQAITLSYDSEPSTFLRTLIELTEA